MIVAHYCQHVLGMGHLFRSLEIARALAPDEVAFITGGRPVDARLPDNVTEHRLPPLMMDEHFTRLLAEGGEDESVVEEVKAIRALRLPELLGAIRPDVLLVELFPFGRDSFAFELLPALEKARAGEYGPVTTACSVRDILVEKPDQAKYERKALDRLNPYFDAVLVHGDPALVDFSETFSRTADMACALEHTGYVAPEPDPQLTARLRREMDQLLPGPGPLVVASAGGGQVGGELLLAAVRASIALAPERPHRLAVFTGPFAGAGSRARLSVAARGTGHIRVAPFADHFPELLAGADLSVSMAGYNTTMNLLAGNTFGLVLPFDQNREQALRAGRLAGRGALEVLDPVDLDPARLAERLDRALDRSAERTSAAHGVNLDGARTSARLLRELAHARSRAEEHA